MTPGSIWMMSPGPTRNASQASCGKVAWRLLVSLICGIVVNVAALPYSTTEK
jgi:hypothetical protein